MMGMVEKGEDGGFSGSLSDSLPHPQPVGSLRRAAGSGPGCKGITFPVWLPITDAVMFPDI